ncbi:MAG: hypothetical protein IIC21_00430 [Chloroflexi bacterium]|nr:hypothetical protein [Chloroflexota bacterium]
MNSSRRARYRDPGTLDTDSTAPYVEDTLEAAKLKIIAYLNFAVTPEDLKLFMEVSQWQGDPYSVAESILRMQGEF